MSVANGSNVACHQQQATAGVNQWTATIRADSVEFFIPMAALMLLNLVIVVGNVMVITAVFTHSKLRGTTTNKFVVSLAFADLMVGVVVMPFSSTNEVLRYWPFGDVWCRMWLAVDVWLCTASILNLCAISLDRYIAISRPVRYPTIMSPLRARLLIVCVWILSFIICFPPLIGWNDASLPDTTTRSNDTTTGPDVTSPDINIVQLDHGHDDPLTSYRVDGQQPCMSQSQQGTSLLPECMLTSVPGYIIYSACGSFWVPMLGMIIFYWKIYKTAVAATDAVNRGFVDQKTEGLINSSPSENALCRLRIHRGGTGGSTMVRHSNGCISELLPRPSANCLQRAGTRRSVDGRLQTTPRTNAAEFELPAKDANRLHTPELMASNIAPLPKIVITASLSCHDEREVNGVRSTSGPSNDVTAGKNENKNSDKMADIDQTEAVTETVDGVKTRPSKPGDGLSKSFDDVVLTARRKSSCYLGLSDTGGMNNTSTPTSVSNNSDKRTSLIASRFAKLHFISQLRNLNKEKRAAKTVGIIVGCFMVCWAPFFTVYLARILLYISTWHQGVLSAVLHRLPGRGIL